MKKIVLIGYKFSEEKIRVSRSWNTFLIDPIYRLKTAVNMKKVRITIEEIK